MNRSPVLLKVKEDAHERARPLDESAPCRRSGHWAARDDARIPALLGLILLALVLAGDFTRAYFGSTVAEGWEYERIARAWAEGNGYSFKGEDRWLFDPADPADQTEPTDFYPTAWEEPIPTLLLGTLFWLFGEDGRLAMTFANALFFAATLVVVYHLGRRILGPWHGLVSATLLALIPTAHSLIKVYLGGSVLAGLLVSICMLLLLWLMERGSVLRGLLLGAVIGVTALTQAATIVFAPTAALLALWSTGPRTWQGWRNAGIIMGATLLVISPWAMRNYATFGEFVLVRNGAGLITYLGNRALAETYVPNLIRDDAPSLPPWTADNMIQAVELIDDGQKRRALELYLIKIFKSSAQGQYPSLNEAQRDKALLMRALQFMVEHPVTTAQLMIAKSVRFLYRAELPSVHLVPLGIVGLLGLFGASIRLAERRVAALTLMTVAYVSVYMVTYPLYYRYRYPIEPVIAVFAGIAVIWLTQVSVQLWSRFAAHRRPVAADDRTGVRSAD